MTDLVRADPDLLEGYGTDADAATDALVPTVDAYRTAWSRFVAGTFVPARTPPAGRAEEVAALLEELRALDGQATGLASALRSLDADGDGAITEADDLDPAFLQLYLDEHAKEPTASGAVLALRARLLQETGEELLTVADRDGETRVVTLDLTALGPLDGLTDLELRELLVAYGLVGENGAPVHVVAHGWTGQSSTAAEHAAQLYDEMGVEGATVLAVNWDAGDSGPWWEAAGSFDEAEAQSLVTGDALSRVLTQLAAANPDADVAVTAHSLGNHVALRALSQMDDPVDPVTGRTVPFRVDYTGIQPAIPDHAYESDPDHYGALVNGRIEHLTLSINNADKALLAYEAGNIFESTGRNQAYAEGGYLTGQEPPPPPDQALGDETTDAAEIQELLRLRDEAGGTTTIVEHHSSDGSGHLTIDPDNSQLVESLYSEQIDRVDHGGARSDITDARERVYEVADEGARNAYLSGVDGDTVFNAEPVQDYLDRCRAAGIDPDPDHAGALAQAEIDRLVQARYDHYVEHDPRVG